MTMILALPGSGEVVVAADTLVCASYDEAFYTSSTEKIWKEGRWFIGVAGHEAGKSVLENIRREGLSFDRDLGSVAYVLAQKVYGIFALRRYRSAPTAITIKAQPTILLSDLFLSSLITLPPVAPNITTSYLINMKILHAIPMVQNPEKGKSCKTKPFHSLPINNSSIWNGLKAFMR